MFRWRKRNEGFEWRDYVRTTILVRREQRRQRLKDVQAAAAAHVKDAGQRGLDAGVKGARAAGTGTWALLQAAAGASVSIAILAGRAIGRAVVAAAGGLAAVARQVGTPLGPILGPVLDYVREPKPSLVLKIVATLAGLGAAYRSWAFGFDGDAIFAAVLFAATAGLVLLAVLTDPYRRPARESLLTRLRAHEVTLPGDRRLSAATAGLAVLGLVAVATAVGTAAHFGAFDGSTQMAASRVTTTGALPARDPARLEGRAQAVTGDRLRIAGTLVALDGIEAPEAGQVCRRKGGTWRCGAAARDALAGLVRDRRTSCDVLDEDGAGVKRARCTAGGTDIAERLVRSGMVFATGGFLAPYAGFESDAAAEGKGLWAGDAERPQDYRDKRWDEAKRTAPDGCPIKGRIRSGARTYVLPWSPSYDSIKLSKARGERWFCSESEAQSAGWSPSAS